MPKTVSASEAKTRFGTILDWVVEQRDEVIVQSYGAPRAVIIAFEEFQKLAELREAERRRQALAALEGLRTKVSLRNRDLDEAQALELADQVVREAVEEMVDQGKVRFQN